MDHEGALKAAVAQRLAKMETNQDTSTVSEIEARLSKSKKLQAAKFFNSQANTLEKTPENSTQPKEITITSKFNSSTQPKVTPVLLKSTSQNKSSPSSNTSTLDIKANLKPVEVKSNVSAIDSSVRASAAVKSKAPAPPPPSSKAPSVVSAAAPTKTPDARYEPPSPRTEEPVNPTSNKDYIALAERARQEYMKKKASGGITTNVAKVENKGPKEITPMRKNTAKSPTTQPQSPRFIEVKPAPAAGEPVKVSIKDRIKSLQSDQPNVSVKGVTEDHSHTEISLSNGTLKTAKTNSVTSSSSTPPSLVSPNQVDDGLAAPPPPGFEDRAASPTVQGVHIDIIPPPSSFSSISPTLPNGVPAFVQEDAASFVSSVSSLSTLSSEQGEHGHNNNNNHGSPGKTNLSIEDLIAPPPPSFSDNGQDTQGVASWSCLDVLAWLDSLSLPQYRVSFAKAQVDGAKLVNMGRTEFIALGVTQVGHRMNLERSVKKMSLAHSTNL